MTKDGETEEDIFLRQLENTMLNSSSKESNGVERGQVVTKDGETEKDIFLRQLENTMLNSSSKESNGVERG